MNVLVIGGSGFIGRRLVDLLLGQGQTVAIYDKVAPDRTNVRVIVGDVRNLHDLAEAMRGQDVVYNLAAEHRDDVRPLSLYEDVNLGGARNVAAAAERAGVKTVIFTSSVAVYGDSDSPLDEHSPHNHINEYGRTKSLAEIEHSAWADADPSRTLVTVRPSVVFGPGNRGNVYNLLRQIALGRFLMVGDGSNRKSMAYVDNVAAFLAHAPAAGAGNHMYNYADAPDFDMNTLVSQIRSHTGQGNGVGARLPLWLARLAGRAADVISAVTGRNLPLSRVRVAKFVANTEVDARKAHASGFTAPVSLRDGLAMTLQSEFPPR